MGLHRLLLLALLALAAAVVVVPGAVAGNFDEEKMGCVGEDPATCPTGTEGQPYSLTIYLAPPDGGRGEDFGCATFHHTSGTFPPGLSISDEGYISGTPTQAGSYNFYLEVRYDKEATCAKPPSQDRFVININPGIPKLTIGPESAPVGTVNTPYALQMTASVPDAKTWSISAGALPPGLAIDASTGAISGTPTTAGTFAFTVHAAVGGDNRTDTKSLAITIRAPLVVSRSSEPLVTEMGLEFRYQLVATGGAEQYTWALTAGALPTGVELGPTGELTGVPEESGRFPFTVTATDSEGRVGAFSGRVLVANTLSIVSTVLRTGKVGRPYTARLWAAGGLRPVAWDLVRGPLPRGVTLDRQAGRLTGIPRRPGKYRIVVEVEDALGVTDRATFRLVVDAAKKPKKQKRASSSR